MYHCNIMHFFYVSINISILQREFYADFSELTTTYFLHYVDHLIMAATQLLNICKTGFSCNHLLIRDDQNELN